MNLKKEIQGKKIKTFLSQDFIYNFNKLSVLLLILIIHIETMII